MTQPSAKTPATAAVEGILGSAFHSIMNQAAAANPAPPMSEPGEDITPVSIVKQIAKHLDRGDHIPAARLSLILASWLARGENLSFADASKLAGLSWSQTAGLPPPPKLG